MVTFDAGQTLIDLDLDFLARRLGERGVVVGRPALDAASPAAWARYDALVDPAGGHPWKQLMAALLEGAGIPEVAPHVDWLWDQQQHANLWRAQIPGMLDLVRDLRARGLRVGVLSNSEGKLAELLAEIGLADVFDAVIDSGRLGIEKPDRRIFDHALAALTAGAPPGPPSRADGSGAAPSATAVWRGLGAPTAAPSGAATSGALSEPFPGIHIGDSWPADIAGALGAGWRAIWFGRRAVPVDDPRVAIARDAAEVRAVLQRWLSPLDLAPAEP